MSRKTERGQALILIVFAILGLIGITALAVDGGNAYAERRRAQNAADSAALGGALARIRRSGWVAATYAIADENGYNNDGETNAVIVNSPPTNGPYAGNVEYIQVIITSYVRTYFAQVLGIQENMVRVEAMSRTKTPEIKEILDGNSVISLAPTSNCENKKSFWVHGEATLDLHFGGVFVNSNNPDCALIQQANGSIRIEDGFINVVGGASIKKPQLLTPYPPNTGVVPISYPPPFMMPKVSCGGDAVISPDGSTMSPGGWGDDFPPPDVHYLESGTYCVYGDFIMDGNSLLEGSGVMIYVPAGRVHWSGGSTISLSANKNGGLANLLLYMPITNRRPVVLNGSSDSAIMGTILAPGADIRILGSSNGAGFHSQIIGFRIEADGQSNTAITYKDEQNYDAMTMPEVQLIK